MFEGVAKRCRHRDLGHADTLVERITGQRRAEDLRIAVNLVMSDAALLAGTPEPSALAGYGVLPAQIARDLVLASPDAALRRIYASPTTGSLTPLESRSRAFPPGLKDFIALRDQTCRNPWCDAPIRHHDHVVAARRHGHHSDRAPVQINRAPAARDAGADGPQGRVPGRRVRLPHGRVSFARPGRAWLAREC
ncbi:hypothetical protein J2W21_001565 [Sinomonas atrocyanea]|uniref:hypothetical protein n=1 Tax=Sinomonas atrocyanea TaxID=37927 RepID=UPI002785DBC5|nr:hypothetical protein [Sinomonas atrocyanea]MDP9884071.1 hypothetical protein [Sinomonas atrocyanea]